MSAFLSDELTSRSVETRRSSPAFIASFRASLMSSRSIANLIESGYAFNRQRRSATSAQIASTSPNGQAPCRNP